jgi:hypothetical protein
VPPILSALGASPATPACRHPRPPPGRPADTAKSQLIPLAKNPADHACPRSQIILIWAFDAIGISACEAVHSGGYSCWLITVGQ